MATDTREYIEDQVNNEFYDRLGERWYTAQDDPVALLRAESRARNPWIIAEICRAFPSRQAPVLDVGCGAGFLSNVLARVGFEVTGLDTSPESLKLAQREDVTGRVRYQTGDANQMPFPDQSFQVVCAMDFLEHVEEPAKVVGEIARLLRPGGLFFFHTFNRNLIAWLVVIKGVEWFVKNTPANMHRLRYFIKPAELRAWCAKNGLQIESLYGLAPKVRNRAFWKMLFTGRVDDDFEFHFTASKLTGYIGIAVKR